jgi:hypothetical protein
MPASALTKSWHQLTQNQTAPFGAPFLFCSNAFTSAIGRVLACGRPSRIGRIDNGEATMSKEQKGNKEKKKPKADSNAPKGGSAYKQGQTSGPAVNPFAPKKK